MTFALQLLAGQRFVDVTLACDGHQVHCHRLVLAACSSYFEALLNENPCKHPIIILPKDVRLWEIQALVDFMYKGQVNVSQAGLAQLLKCAETLQIRGLCGNDSTLNDVSTKTDCKTTDVGVNLLNSSQTFSLNSQNLRDDIDCGGDENDKLHSTSSLNSDGNCGNSKNKENLVKHSDGNFKESRRNFSETNSKRLKKTCDNDIPENSEIIIKNEEIGK